MASIIHLGKSGLPTKAITDDDLDRIATCIRSLWEATPLMYAIYDQACRQSLSTMLVTKAAEEKEYAKVCFLSLNFIKNTTAHVLSVKREEDSACSS
jgi:hypothetical protein